MGPITTLQLLLPQLLLPQLLLPQLPLPMLTHMLMLVLMLMDTMVLSDMLVSQLSVTTVPTPSQLLPRLKYWAFKLLLGSFIGFKFYIQRYDLSYSPIYSPDG